MSLQRLTEAVRAHLVAQFATGKATFETKTPALSFQPDDVVAFIDFQNLHYFLKENCKVSASHVHVPNLVTEFGAMHSLPIKEMVIVTGIHDAQREPVRYDAMARRAKWLSHNGARVITIPLIYRHSEEQGWIAAEKGVDVRIACELVKYVFHGLRRAVVMSQDIDLGQSILVAKDVAKEMGRSFHAFTPRLEGAEWAHNGRSGRRGLMGSTTLPFPVQLARKHVRAEAPRDE